ncbi:hypothetical protein NCLIV_059260 [Neospora caninum Liverpool]|uniref:ADA2-A transcriptional co-activator SAGA component n=1 Tax=Neospora caninum (strain Liverpool) TaxID=572307 RepID=F0VP55_NEOCL|nr:hypothetical protein NCLIV_059260 [Neospora caninum Liverpool]CBZ55501.1 hypothetical protein NCLIV_059260 [Neospora caninum Liverpool]CEL70239.1 TPA: ADA2-A transcriptional co-activator SAGA component [Neospora caninum Liverpool]|eukprot:XP_003885529.1 hypothetical protein NCLIV_059260 [Neospora caninum Liverpool]
MESDNGRGAASGGKGRAPPQAVSTPGSLASPFAYSSSPFAPSSTVPPASAQLAFSPVPAYATPGAGPGYAAQSRAYASALPGPFASGHPPFGPSAGPQVPFGGAAAGAPPTDASSAPLPNGAFASRDAQPAAFPFSQGASDSARGSVAAPVSSSAAPSSLPGAAYPSPYPAHGLQGVQGSLPFPAPAYNQSWRGNAPPSGAAFAYPVQKFPQYAQPGFYSSQAPTPAAGGPGASPAPAHAASEAAAGAEQARPEGDTQASEKTSPEKARRPPLQEAAGPKGEQEPGQQGQAQGSAGSSLPCSVPAAGPGGLGGFPSAPYQGRGGSAAGAFSQIAGDLPGAYPPAGFASQPLATKFPFAQFPAQLGAQAAQRPPGGGRSAAAGAGAPGYPPSGPYPSGYSGPYQYTPHPSAPAQYAPALYPFSPPVSSGVAEDEEGKRAKRAKPTDPTDGASTLSSAVPASLPGNAPQQFPASSAGGAPSEKSAREDHAETGPTLSDATRFANLGQTPPAGQPGAFAASTPPLPGAGASPTSFSVPSSADFSSFPSSTFAPSPFPALEGLPMDQQMGSLVEDLGAFGLAQYHCDVCTKDISNVCRIRCAECEDFDLCVACFCMGAEVEGKPHKNSHRYIPIGKNAFPLLRHNWTADEELRLLEGVSKYGFGNWNDVAELVNSVALTAKTAAECDQHYAEVYLNSRTSPLPDTSVLLLGKDGGPLKQEDVQEAAKSRGAQDDAKAKEEDKEGETVENRGDEDDASRPAGGVAPPSRAGTAKPTHSIVGYWPLRGDFDVEYDNDAELILADMEFKEDEAVQERYLKLQIIEIYNSKLDERLYRKRTVINRGLLDTKTLHQREKKRTKEERDLHNLFKPLARFHSDEEQERLVQLLIEEKRIRARLSMLHEWKSLGLKTADDVGEYEGDKSWREQLQRFRASELSSLFFSGGLANLFAKHTTAQQTGKPLPLGGSKVCISPSSGCTYSPDTPHGGLGSGAGDTPTNSNASSPSAGNAAATGSGLSMSVAVVERLNGEKGREAEKGKREGKEKGDEKGGRLFKGGRCPGEKESESPPISAFPGAGLLTEKERAFCEDAQLAPVFYLLAKRMLLREMAKHKKFNATDFSKPMELYVNRVGQLYDFYVNVSDFAPACPSPPANPATSRGAAFASPGVNAASVASPRPSASPSPVGPSASGGVAPATSAFYRTVAGATPGIEPMYSTVNGGLALQPPGYALPVASMKSQDASTGPLCSSPYGTTSQGGPGLLSQARDAS